MTEPLTEDKIAEIRRLRQNGVSTTVIAAKMRVPFVVIYRLLDGPQWPKLVRRIEADGTAMIVRCS